MKVLIIDGSPRENGNTYIAISEMPVASSRYWNSLHGEAAGEAAEDGEGLQTMRTLARNMSFLIKSIAL